jgi:hypothetical protein
MKNFMSNVWLFEDEKRDRLLGTSSTEIKKNGRLLTSHRYNRLPLLRSHPGGVQQELVVQDLPAQR